MTRLAALAFIIVLAASSCGAPHMGRNPQLTDPGAASQSGAPFPAAAKQPVGPPGVSSPGPVSVPGPTAAIGSALYSGVASWFDARGDQGAVPWWTPGQSPVWASVSTFSGGRTRSVTVLITGWCGCYVGTPRERVMDLSPSAFAQLAPLSVGLIRASIEVPAQGPPLPATSTEEKP